MTCKERFLKYIAVSTASDEDSTESPSTTRQLELSRRLAEEMLSLGLKNVHMDSCGNAIGTLPATEGVKAAGTLALVAHVDTAPAANGEGGEAAGTFDIKKIFPFFILFFVLASVITTVFALPAGVTAPIKELSKFFIVMALSLIHISEPTRP